MSNIAGKAYAMNVVTPINWYTAWVNKLIFWFVTTPIGVKRLKGLLTLSIIHYARWTILSPRQFPHLDKSQPKENLKYHYMFFFSNFNGSWAQYVDSFHTSIPEGLDLFWSRNVRYPRSVPLKPFHEYISYNQVWTNHYYSAYPIAASNDVKSAKKLKTNLLSFIDKNPTAHTSPEDFKEAYNKLVLDLQHDLSQMAPTPVVSLAAEAVSQRKIKDARISSGYDYLQGSSLSPSTSTSEKLKG